MSIPKPTFVRLEYWAPGSETWWVGHKGINLMDPQAYVEGALENIRKQREAKERKGLNPGPVVMVRAVDVDTGEIFEPEGAELL